MLSHASYGGIIVLKRKIVVLCAGLVLMLGQAGVVHAQDAPAPWRFAVLGDCRGTASNSGVNEAILARLVIAMMNDSIDCVLFGGDQVYGQADRKNKGDAGALQRLRDELMTYRRTMEPLYQHGIFVYNVRGNHEAVQNEPIHTGYPDHRPIWPEARKIWDSVFSGPYAMPANGPEGEKNVTFSVVHKNALFVGMDLYSTPVPGAVVNADGSINTPYYHKVDQGWLEKQLRENDRPHVFAFTHEPAFKLDHTDCLHGDNAPNVAVNYSADRDTFWRALGKAGSRVYFAGHDHGYLHSRIDDGDGNPYNDLHQYVAGTAGAGKDSKVVYDGYNGPYAPVTMHAENKYGYVLVEVHGMDVTVTWKHMTDEATGRCETAEVYQYTVGTSTSAPDHGENMPGFRLEHNSPNPFNPTTMITYTLPHASQVALEVFDMTGRKIATLDEGMRSEGAHTVTWNGDVDGAGHASSGVYLCRLQADTYVGTRKMVLLD